MTVLIWCSESNENQKSLKKLLPLNNNYYYGVNDLLLPYTAVDLLPNFMVVMKSKTCGCVCWQ